MAINVYQIKNKAIELSISDDTPLSELYAAMTEGKSFPCPRCASRTSRDLPLDESCYVCNGNGKTDIAYGPDIDTLQYKPLTGA